LYPIFLVLLEVIWLRGSKAIKHLFIRKPRVGAERPTARMVRAQKEYVLANELLWGGPMAFFYEYEVRPLTDYASFVDGGAAAIDRQGR
jgi:hypothetical protein